MLARIEPQQQQQQQPVQVQQATPPTPTVIDFGDVSEAFNVQSFYHLLRAYVVLKACSWRWVVLNHNSLIKQTTAVFGQRLVDTVLQATFSAHFCAGVTAADAVATLQTLEQRAGVGGILQYHAEKDTGSVQSDEEFAFNTDRAVESVTAGARFAAIKLTALGDPSVLQRLSLLHHDLRRLFRSLATYDTAADGAGGTANVYLAGQVQRADLQAHLAACGLSAAEVSRTEQAVFANGAGDDAADYLQWLAAFPVFNLHTEPLQKVLPTPPLTTAELGSLERLRQRLNRIADAAAEHKVGLLVDAEQSYLQPAIDAMVLDLQRHHNRGTTSTDALARVIVFNTFQSYLTDCRSRLRLDLLRAEREGWNLGVKLVRGAYMAIEPALAAKHGYKRPLCADRAATTRSYHACLDMLLQAVPKCQLFVAGHNEGTVNTALARMKELGLPNRGAGVYFGQLLGMCDHVSFNLSKHGYDVHKVLAYGPVRELLPFLGRRAVENSAVFDSAPRELELLRDELLRRTGLA